MKATELLLNSKGDIAPGVDADVALVDPREF